MERHIKQIIIGLVYLLFLAAIGLGIYLIVKPSLPSCSDGIKNQGETEVDCGGPCLSCPWELRKDLEVIFREAIKTKDNYLDLAAKIKNPNSNWGAKSFSYTFDLYNTDNSLVASKEGTSYILSQETKYIIQQRVLAEAEISNVEFRVVDITWQELIDYEEVELIIRNPEFEQSENFSQLTATLENRSSYNLDKVDVYAVLFDKESKTLGVGKLELRTILSKELRYFEISWFFPLEGEFEKFDIVAKTNLFLDENFMGRYKGRREGF